MLMLNFVGRIVSTSVSADCSTRWSSTLAMMDILMEQEAAVRRILADDRKTAGYITGWYIYTILWALD